MLLLLVFVAAPYTAESFEALRREEARKIAQGAPIGDASLAASLESALAADRTERDDALMRFAARLVAIGDREPERAMRWLPKLPYKNEGNYIPRLRATEFLFRRWVQRDPPRAAAAALQFWRDGHGHPVSDLLHEWAQLAPADAIAWVRALDEKERTALAAYEQLLGVLPSVDPHAALALAEVVPERYSFALIGAYSQILPRLVATNIETALAAYARYEARAPADAKKCVQALVGAWAERQPERAVAFAESQLDPTEPRRYAALQAIATTWAHTNSRGAADLSLRAIREQRQHRAFEYDHRHGPKQDPLADIIASWAAKNRASAVAWVERIDEVDLREHLLQVLGVSRPKPTPPPPKKSRRLEGASSPSEVKYGLLDYYGGVFFCDPDLYPVHDSANEQRRAVEVFPTIAADARHYAAILKRLGAAPEPNPSPQLQLEVYREHKKLEAVRLETREAGYVYELRLAHALVTGRVERSLITETSRKKQRNTCPVCLAENTLIDTPTGAVPVTQLQVGSRVWTRDGIGTRIAAPVLRVGRSPAPREHRMVRLVLQDGRGLSASPNHPLADGRSLLELRAGHVLDGAIIVSVDLVPYEGTATYDLLPAGDTGVYWADGVPLGSTLD